MFFDLQNSDLMPIFVGRVLKTSIIRKKTFFLIIENISYGCRVSLRQAAMRFAWIRPTLLAFGAIAHPKRPRYTRGFFWRACQDFLGKAVSSSQFWWRCGLTSNVGCFPRVTRASQASCCQWSARHRTFTHWYSGIEPNARLSSLPTPLDYMSSFLIEINIFASIDRFY